MRRGEVWWAEFPKPLGRRRVLLLSRDSAYSVRNSVIAAVITYMIRGIPTEVLLDQQDGMTAKCAVNLDNILTIPISCLAERTTVLSQDKMSAVTRAMLFAMDLKP